MDWWIVHLTVVISTAAFVPLFAFLAVADPGLPGFALLLPVGTTFVASGLLSLPAYYLDSPRDPLWKKFVLASLVLTPYVTAPIYLFRKHRLGDLSLEFRPPSRRDLIPGWGAVTPYVVVSFVTVSLVFLEMSGYCGDIRCTEKHPFVFGGLLVLAVVGPAPVAGYISRHVKIGGPWGLFQPTRQQALAILAFYAGVFGLLYAELVANVGLTDDVWIYPVAVLAPWVYLVGASGVLLDLLPFTVPDAALIPLGVNYVFLVTVIAVAWTLVVPEAYRRVFVGLFPDRRRAVPAVLVLAVVLTLGVAYLNVTVPLGRHAEPAQPLETPEGPGVLGNQSVENHSLRYAETDVHNRVIREYRSYLRRGYYLTGVEVSCYSAETQFATAERYYVDVGCYQPEIHVVDEWGARKGSTVVPLPSTTYMVNRSVTRHLKYFSVVGGTPVHSGADLSGTNLSGVDLSDAVVRNADFSGANLSGAVLNDTELSGSNLSKADLRGALAVDTNFTGAVIVEARMGDAYLWGADLRGVAAEEVVLRDTGLQNSIFVNADLDRGFLGGAELHSTEFGNASLRGAGLQNASFYRTDLRNADLTGANLSGARYLGDRFAPSAYLGGCRCPPEIQGEGG